MSAFSLSRKWHCYRLLIVRKMLGVLFLLALLLAFQSRMACGAHHAGEDRPLTEQEAWVLNQVKEGRQADLEKRFGGEAKKHELRAGFLKKLLLGDFKDFNVPYQGVAIADAVIVDGPLDLKYLEIGYPLTLSHCVFSDQITLVRSQCKNDLSFVDSTFLKSADFRGMKISGSLNCDHTRFEEACSWADAEIGEKFLAEGAEFRSQVHKADFHTMKVGTEALFPSAKFYGPVDFELVRIGMRLNMNQTEFFHKKETADFLAMIVDKYVLFNGARFHGPVNFVIVQVGLQFWANGAKFLNPEATVDFRGIKTGNSIFFQEAQFQGPVRFEFSEIGANFRGSGAKLLNACQAKSFAQMKVGQKVFLDGVTICCGFDLSYGDFHDLEISGVIKDQQTAQDSTMNLPRLNLIGIQVQRELTVADASIDELLASNVQVKGPAHFRNLAIKTLADFRHSSFQAMDFQQVAWPKPKKEDGKMVRKLCLSELTYNSISIDKPEDSDHSADYSEKDFRAINRFLEDSTFNTQTYVQLESFFKSIGKESWANKTFIRMHDRDLEENYHWADPVRWLEWLFWGKLAGYGKKPFRVFFISLALIILGACLFDPEYLMDNKMSSGGRTYRTLLIRFFLSLDRFLPIELGLSKHWNAKASRFPIWFYFHLQQILGWILIPIALASIYTQIK
jgi:uncharacterized protein YjbI with pentapeptide repeats